MHTGYSHICMHVRTQAHNYLELGEFDGSFAAWGESSVRGVSLSFLPAFLYASRHCFRTPRLALSEKSLMDFTFPVDFFFSHANRSVSRYNCLRSGSASRRAQYRLCLSAADNDIAGPVNKVK